MKQSNYSSSSEFEDKRYVIIKIPRDSLHSNYDIPFLMGVGVQKRIWIVLCIFSLLLGVVIGSFFHPSLAYKTPDKAVWKSANLTTSDNK
jgi:hypothetical protein